jgi:hypothetical protein
MEPVSDVGLMESRFSRLEIVLLSVEDRCMVCTEHTRHRNYFGRTRWDSYVTPQVFALHFSII